MAKRQPNTNPDASTTDQGPETVSYREMFEAAPERQQKQMIGAAHDEALALWQEAYELNRKHELAEVRRVIAESQKHGARWSSEEISGLEKDVEDRIENPSQRYLSLALENSRRPAKIAEKLDKLIAREPGMKQTGLREEARGWVTFLERENGDVSPVELAEEALSQAKSFQDAYRESPLSPKVIVEAQRRQFEIIQRRSEKHLGSRQERLRRAAEWTRGLVKDGPSDQQERDDRREPWLRWYTRHRFEVWSNRILDGKLSKLLIGRRGIAAIRQRRRDNAFKRLVFG